jgi:hypothetical protein
MIMLGAFLPKAPEAGLVDTPAGVLKTILILIGFGLVLEDTSEKRPRNRSKKG